MPARKPPPPAFESSAREYSSARSSRICRLFSRKCPRRHPIALCRRTSRVFRRLQLKSTTRISPRASSFSPCTVVTPDPESFHPREPQQSAGALMLKCRARRNDRERNDTFCSAASFKALAAKFWIHRVCSDAAHALRAAIARTASPSPHCATRAS